MSKFANWAKQNPGMVGGVMVLVIAIIAFLIWFSFFRGSEVKPPIGPGAAGNTGPELDISGIKTVNPVTTSGYTIESRYEFALGDFIGDNIDFTINITTKGGFEESGITNLLIRRYKSDGTTILNSVTVENIKNYMDYQATFLGSDLTADAVGQNGGSNIFKVFGVTVAETDATPATLFDADSNTDGTQELGSSTQNITKPELNYTAESIKNSPFTFTMSSGTAVFGNLGKEITRTTYIMSIDDSKPYNIKLSSVADEYEFVDLSDVKFTVDGNMSFKVDKIGDKYRLYVGDKFVTRTGGDGDLTFKEPHNMTPEEANTSMITLHHEPIYTGGKFWLVQPMNNAAGTPTKYMFWANTDGKLGRWPFATENEEHRQWEIVPSGNNDNKYWLVQTMDNAGTPTKYMFWSNTDGTLGRWPFATVGEEHRQWEIVSGVKKCWSYYTNQYCTVVDGNYTDAKRGRWILDPYNGDTKKACDQRAVDMAGCGLETKFSVEKPA